MSIPLEGDEYAKLIEHIRKAQEASAMLAHLCKDKSEAQSRGWLIVSEQLKLFQHTVTLLATRKLRLS